MESFVLETPAFALPHVAVLSAIARQDTVAPRRFSWGALEGAPFLPGLTSGRLIFRLPTWNIAVERLTCLDSAREAFTQYAREWNMPHHVLMTSLDQRLPIDTRSNIGLEIVVDAARRVRTSRLAFEAYPHEYVEAFIRGPGGRYHAEFVSRVRIPSKRQGLCAAPQWTDEYRSAVGDWVSMELLCPVSLMDFALREFQALLATTGTKHDWYFVRLTQPQPHIRLRVKTHAAMEFLTTLVPSLDGLVQSSVIEAYRIQPYVAEVDRYGGQVGFATAERGFVAGTARLSEHLGHLVRAPSTRLEVTLRTAMPLLYAVFGIVQPLEWRMGLAHRGVLLRKGLRWDVVRRVQDAVLEHIDREPEATLAAELAGAERSGQLTAPALTVLHALLHMHFNRCGYAPSDEASLLTHLWHCFEGIRHRAHTGAVSGR